MSNVRAAVAKSSLIQIKHRQGRGRTLPRRAARVRKGAKFLSDQMHQAAPHQRPFFIPGLLAMIDLPDFGTPIRSIADSVERIADAAPGTQPGGFP